MATKNFVNEVRIKVQFLETSISREFNFITLRAPKSLVFLGQFLQVYMGNHRTLVRASMYLMSSGRLG